MSSALTEGVICHGNYFRFLSHKHFLADHRISYVTVGPSFLVHIIAPQNVMNFLTTPS